MISENRDRLKGRTHRVSMEIVIEIRQLYSGRIESNPFIASNRRYIVFPLRDHFIIENELIDKKNIANGQEIIEIHHK